MEEGKKDLLDILKDNVQELQQGLNTHCCLINSLLEGQVDEGKLQGIRKQCLKCSREQKLEEAIKESIEVLEETRKSFKSKKLAELRKKLTQVLIDSD
jgi:hypothetical protein